MVVQEYVAAKGFGVFAAALSQVFGPLKYDFGKLIVLAVLTPLICILIIFTNILLIFTIARNRHLRKPFNYYIISMCVSDLLAIEWIVPYVVYYVQHDTTLWNTNMHAFFLVAAFLNSMYTMVALSVHRFRGIVQPLKPAFSRRQTLYTILYIWLSIIVFTAIYAGIKFHCYPDVFAISGSCPKVRVGQYNAFGFLHLLIIIFGYFVPVLASTVLFAITAYKLRGAETGQQHETSIKTKAKAFKMCVTLFLLFLVLWTPYWSFMIYWHQTRRDPTLYYDPGSEAAGRANFLHNLAIFLALCYSWANMFVYMYFGRELRRAVLASLERLGLKTSSTKAALITTTSSSGSLGKKTKTQTTLTSNNSMASVSGLRGSRESVGETPGVYKPTTTTFF